MASHAHGQARSNIPREAAPIELAVNPDKPPATKKFTPLMEGVCIEIIARRQTASGIVLPDNLRQDSYETPIGRVIAVGKDVKEVKVGQRVLLGNAPMHAVIFGGDRLIVTAEAHIVGIVDEDN